MSDPHEATRLRRKQRSEVILKKAKVQINEWLPGIEVESEIKLRSAEEIAQRAVCLCIVSAKHQIAPEKVRQIIDRYGASNFFTKDEQAYLQEPIDTESAAQFSWRIEASWVLLWALGFVKELGLPKKSIYGDQVVVILEKHGMRGLVAHSKRRSASEILDENDLIYRCNWAAREAYLHGREPSGGLNANLANERHLALNWLISPDSEDWDDVSTDT
jgi:hypothetical protein